MIWRGEFSCICRETFIDIYAIDKIYHKIRENCHYTGEYRVIYAARTICKLKYSMPKEINIIFLNGSNYDDHLIINEIQS